MERIVYVLTTTYKDNRSEVNAVFNNKKDAEKIQGMMKNLDNENEILSQEIIEFLVLCIFFIFT